MSSPPKAWIFFVFAAVLLGGCHANLSGLPDFFGRSQMRGAAVVIRSATGVPISYEILAPYDSIEFGSMQRNGGPRQTDHGLTRQDADETSNDSFFYDSGRFVIRYQCGERFFERRVIFRVQDGANEFELDCGVEVP